MEATTTTTTAATEVSRKPFFFVLQSGLITSAVALAGVYWLNKNTDDFNIMGWYADYVLPVGAVIVGFVAGSGYGLASWFTGIRISRWLLAVVLILQACSYLGAEYVEFRDVRARLEARNMVMRSTGELPTFFDYYDYKARNFAWKAEHSNKSGEALGAAGYFFVLLGAAGFILSGLIAPAILMAVPYCESCQRYMSSKVLAVLPASIAARKVSKSDPKAQQAYADEQARAVSTAEEIMQRLRSAAAEKNPQAFSQELVSHGQKKTNNKLLRRLEISLIWCKSCNCGHILPAALAGHGKRQQKTKLEKMQLAPEFVRGLLEQPA